MTVALTPVDFADVRPDVLAHLGGLVSPPESFYERHILNANHYRIYVDGAPAGFVAIHGEGLLTQFAMLEKYTRYAQEAFFRLRHQERMREALVLTSDESFMIHALDGHKQVVSQSHVFRRATVIPGPVRDFTLEKSSLRDLEFIRENSGDFFGARLEAHLTAGAIYLTLRQGEPAGFGLIEKSALWDDVASLGVFTIEAARNSGAGTATISRLLAECQRANIRPLAGCAYYNHASKRTLERAGMVAQSRLLRFSY